MHPESLEQGLWVSKLGLVFVSIVLVEHLILLDTQTYLSLGFARCLSY